MSIMPQDPDSKTEPPPLACDAPTASFYMSPDGVETCTCIVCARCDRHTGNGHQGHYWGYCEVTKTVREFHFCCPGACELEAAARG